MNWLMLRAIPLRALTICSSWVIAGTVLVLVLPAVIDETWTRLADDLGMLAGAKLVASTVTFVVTATTLVVSMTGGVKVATILTMNSSMRSSPSFLRNV